MGHRCKLDMTAAFKDCWENDNLGFQVRGKEREGEKVGAEIISLGPDRPGRLEEEAEGKLIRLGEMRVLPNLQSLPPGPGKERASREQLDHHGHQVYRQVHIQGVAVNPGETL